MKKVILLFLMIFSIFFVGLSEVYATGETITISDTDVAEPVSYLDSDDYSVTGEDIELYLIEKSHDDAVFVVFVYPSCVSDKQFQLSDTGLLDTLLYSLYGQYDEVTVSNLTPSTEYTFELIYDWDCPVSYHNDAVLLSNTQLGTSSNVSITFTTNSAHTVTYDSNGGSAVTAEEDIEDGELATEPTDPARTGYTFERSLMSSIFCPIPLRMISRFMRIGISIRIRLHTTVTVVVR